VRGPEERDRRNRVVSERPRFPPVHPPMWRKFKTQLSDFRRSPAGERFQTHYKARQKSAKNPAAFSRILNLILAAVSFVLGIVFSIIPGIPGFLFFLVTAALLAAESFRVARFLDSTELKVRGWWQWVKRRRTKVARAVHPGHHAKLSRVAK
jgi:hypothetical protein